MATEIATPDVSIIIDLAAFSNDLAVGLSDDGLHEVLDSRDLAVKRLSVQSACSDDGVEGAGSLLIEVDIGALGDGSDEGD